MADHTDDQPRIWDVTAGWRFPDLGPKVVPAGARTDVVVDEADWVDFDTADRDLLRHGAALSVADGARWQLVLDGEVTTATAAGRAVPAALRDVLFGVRAGYALRAGRPVRRERVSRVVIDAGAQLLGEIDDVTEHAGDGTHLSRRVEVIAGDPGFDRAVAKTLRRSGARPRPADAGAHVGAHDGDDTIGSALRAFIAARTSDIRRGDVGLRRGGDVVHPTRVAIRRLRSVIRVVDVFAAEPAAALDAELSWWAQVLGAVRDVEVLRARFAAVAAHADTAAEGASAVAVAAALAAADAALAADAGAARQRLATALTGRRYVALLRELRRWSDEPPFAARVGKPAAGLTKYARAAEQTMRRRVRRADDEESTHRARKAAKRARYVAEFVQEVTADDPGTIVRRARKVQTTLGERQDAAVAAQFLRELATRPGVGAQAAFGCGVLWAAELRRAAGQPDR